MELLKGWEWKRLGEITECLDSKRIPINSNQRKSMKGEVPYYGSNGQVDSINEFIFNEELLLVAEDGGSWGKNEKCAYIIREKSWVNNHAHVLRMKSTIKIKFLEVYLNLTDLTPYISGTTRGKLNQKQLNEIIIPLPPLPIQKQIVSILERAENLKQKREFANGDTNKVIQSIFIEMFGNYFNEKIISKIQDVCDVKGGKRIPKGEKFSDGKTNIPYLRVTDMVNHTIKKDNLKYITEEVFNKIRNYTISKEDVYITIAGTIGLCGTIPDDLDCASLTENACKLIIKNKKILNKVYLSYALTSNYLQKQIQSRIGIVGVPKLALFRIKMLEIPTPPIELQNKFALIVEKIEFLKENQNQSTQEINHLFEALMQKAFKGELVVS